MFAQRAPRLRVVSLVRQRPLAEKIPAPIKIKSALPPPPQTQNTPPPPLNRGILWTWRFSCRKNAEILGAHRIGAAISGPRVVDKNFTDTRCVCSGHLQNGKPVRRKKSGENVKENGKWPSAWNGRKMPLKWKNGPQNGILGHWHFAQEANPATRTYFFPWIGDRKIFCAGTLVSQCSVESPSTSYRIGFGPPTRNRKKNIGKI